MKHKKNVSFLEARKTVGPYIGEKSYAFFTGRAYTANEDNKYRTLVDILIQFEPYDWPKSQEHLIKLYSAEF